MQGGLKIECHELSAIQIMPHTSLHGYAVYIMISAAVFVALWAAF